MYICRACKGRGQDLKFDTACPCCSFSILCIPRCTTLSAELHVCSLLTPVAQSDVGKADFNVTPCVRSESGRRCDGITMRGHFVPLYSYYLDIQHNTKKTTKRLWLEIPENWEVNDKSTTGMDESRLGHRNMGRRRGFKKVREKRKKRENVKRVKYQRGVWSIMQSAHISKTQCAKADRRHKHSTRTPTGKSAWDRWKYLECLWDPWRALQHQLYLYKTVVLKLLAEIILTL